MQKKLITLAVAGLLSAPVFAQSNVVLYGSIDYGYVSLGNNAVKDVKSRNAIDSGITRENRFGIMGTENLGTLMGHGLKAVFVLETGLNGDVSPLLKDARQTYVALESIFGTVGFGRQETSQHDYLGIVDPFGKYGLGSAGNVLIQEKRQNSLFTYTSPVFGGFRFTTGWTFSAGEAIGIPGYLVDAPPPGPSPIPPPPPFDRQPNDPHGSGAIGNNQEAQGNDGDIRAWSFSPSFGWKNWFLGANYHSSKVHRSYGKDIKAFNAYDFFASYDFGFVKLGTMLGRRTTGKDVYSTFATAAGYYGYTAKDAKLTQWMLGATFRITPRDSVLVSYSRAGESKVFYKPDYCGGSDTGFCKEPGSAKINQWALGYEHAFSKRTVLYSQFAMQKHNKSFSDHGFLSLVTDSSGGSVGSNYLGHDLSKGYRRGFVAGMRHDF